MREPGARRIVDEKTLHVLFELTLYTHSVWLLLVTALDVAVIALTWHEYRYLRSNRHVI
jgi:uncharacterized membrane protein